VQAGQQNFWHAASMSSQPIRLPNAEANLRKYIDAAWPALTTMGLTKNASRERLSFTADMKSALSYADLVQENGPERPDFKIKLFADMDAATAPIR
jgi:3-hydroxyacyl-CoA dehydrogenase